MKHQFFIAVLTVLLMSGPLQNNTAWAADDKHNHQAEAQEKMVHDEVDETDENNHGMEEGEHDDHGNENEDEHEEGKVEILPDSAKLAGVEVMPTAPAVVAVIIPLTGRIVLNENKIANVRARFPGFVKAVHVNLGDVVKKGQKLISVESNESLKTYAVTAPMNGVILKRKTNVGDVTDGKELFVIADLSTVWAKYHIFPRDIENIKKGQFVDVHALDEKTRQMAEISMLFPTTDTLSQTVIAVAELSNKKGVWRPGMTIEGDVKVDKKQVAIAVPKTALQFLEGQQVVFVKNGNSYEPRPVEVGMMGNKNVEIISGLKNGEIYVSAGSFVIKADLLKATAAHAH